MVFLSLLVALLAEQVRPLPRSHVLHTFLRDWAAWVQQQLFAGKAHHAWAVVGFAALVPTLIVAVLSWAIAYSLGWLGALLFNGFILYFTLGFRQFSHHFTTIRDALQSGKLREANLALAVWRRQDAMIDPTRGQVVRALIDFAIVAAHRHVFGVIVWFVALSYVHLGASGAVFYRLCEFLYRFYGSEDRSALSQVAPPVSSNAVVDATDLPVVTDAIAKPLVLQEAAQSCWYTVDWLPARITSVGFALVGNFEDTLNAWRQQLDPHQSLEKNIASNDALLQAATAGAMALADDESAQGAHLQSVVGLVWRLVVLWMLLLGIYSVMLVLPRF